MSQEQERTGPEIPAEFLRDCEWSESPIYGCDHCRKNGTFDPSRYSFKPQSEIPVDYGPKIPLMAVGQIQRPGDPDVRRIVEGWQENSRTSPNTKYARYELTERDRNPVDEAFQRGIFGKGRPGVENSG